MATKRKTKKKAKSRDELLATLEDGCESRLVEGARFDGVLEIPVIERPETLAVPAGLVPFSKRFGSTRSASPCASTSPTPTSPPC